MLPRKTTGWTWIYSSGLALVRMQRATWWHHGWTTGLVDGLKTMAVRACQSSTSSMDLLNQVSKFFTLWYFSFWWDEVGRKLHDRVYHAKAVACDISVAEYSRNKPLVFQLPRVDIVFKLIDYFQRKKLENYQSRWSWCDLHRPVSLFTVFQFPRRDVLVHGNIICWAELPELGIDCAPAFLTNCQYSNEQA